MVQIYRLIYSNQATRYYLCNKLTYSKMKYFLSLAIALFLFTSCQNELTFEEKSFRQISSLPCDTDCPHADVKIPFAKNVPIVADSINAKVFSTMKEIIYVGEKPYKSNDYDDLLTSFMRSYERMQKQDPAEKFGWEAEVVGTVKYESEAIVNIEIKHYTFTGGAHGYSGMRSLIFDRETGKWIPEGKLFKDKDAFQAFAEKKFRTTYAIADNQPINSTGLMFEEEIFHLPQTFFFTETGFLLYYNVYEIASYADGPKKLLISYSEMEPYLAIK